MSDGPAFPIFKRGDFKHSDRLVSDLVTEYIANGLKGTLQEKSPEDLRVDEYRQRARNGDPFPLIAMQWPELLVTDPSEAVWFEGEIGNPDNPCLRLDAWQRNDVIKPFFDMTVAEVAIKGNTKAGKGASVSLCVNIWFDIYDAKIILTSQKWDHAKDVIFGEVAKWREKMQHPGPGMLYAASIGHTTQHYITISNPATGEGFCHDDQTEVMTMRGWVPWGDVRDDDLFLTMDQKTHEATYARATAISRQFYEGPIYLYDARGANFCVTPKHSMFCERAASHQHGKGRFDFEEIRSIKGSRRYLKRGIKWTGKRRREHVIPSLSRHTKYRHDEWPERRIDFDAWVTFLGWYFSDGNLKAVRGRALAVEITQCKPQTIPLVRSAIAAIGIPFCEYTNHSGRTVFAINSVQLAEHLAQYGWPKRNRRVPLYVRTSHRSQIKLFVDAFAGGDGFWQTNKRRIVYGSYRGLIDDVHELALKAGYQSFVEKRNTAGEVNVIDGRQVVTTRDKYLLSISPNVTNIKYMPRKATMVNYRGMVYCAHIPKHHLLFTRRDGKTLWSGNSGQHGDYTLFVLDEATSIDDGRYDDAQKQARKIVALANPRTLFGWFRSMFKPCRDPNVSELVDGPFGKRMCVTVDGANCLNVRAKRLEKPVGPPGGIEIKGRVFAHNEYIPPDYFAQVRVLIPQQCDYGRFKGILLHPDQRHVDVFGHGKFPLEDPEKQVILGSWLDRHEAAYLSSALPLVDCFGLDVARSLDGDATCLAAGGLQGLRAVHRWHYADTTYHVRETLRIAKDEYGVDLTKGRIPVCVDMDGLGAGVGDQLRALGVWVLEFRGNARSEVDPSVYGNLRAEAYGTLGRRLNPDDRWGGEPWPMPRDTHLRQELTAPEKLYGADPLRFLISPKNKPPDSRSTVQSIKEKLGRSPDTADAVVYMFAAVRAFHNLNEWMRSCEGDLVVSSGEFQNRGGKKEDEAESSNDLLGWLAARYGDDVESAGSIEGQGDASPWANLFPTD